MSCRILAVIRCVCVETGMTLNDLTPSKSTSGLDSTYGGLVEASGGLFGKRRALQQVELQAPPLYHDGLVVWQTLNAALRYQLQVMGPTLAIQLHELQEANGFFPPNSSEPVEVEH